MAADGCQLADRLSTLRHLWGTECSEQPNVEETARSMRRSLERAAAAVVAAGARGSSLHHALVDAAHAMACTAAERAARSDDSFAHVRRVLAIDLPPPPQLADGTDAEEKRERAELARQLAIELRSLVHVVATAEYTWRDATTRVVIVREQRENRRE